MKIKHFLPVALLAACNVLNAQSETDFKHCGSDEMLRQLYLERPEMQAEEEYLHQRGWEEGKQNLAGNRSSVPSPYIIPVVFHVVHDYGVENISDAQIMDAVKILNDDFRKRNADTSSIVAPFQLLAADCDIEFRLAQLDPEGNCTNGIDRIPSMETYVGDNECKLNQWPRNQYLNIWVVRSILSGAAGYAYYPSSVNGANDAWKDGIVILQSYVGSIGTGNLSTARALTHEVGHYLSLPHVWGSTNNPGVACGDDGILDTPETKGWTTCNLISNDVCNAGINENVQNYMEYAYCQRMYTYDQANAMQYALNSSVSGRNNLWTPANLAATGCLNVQPVCAPHADFDATRRMVCQGGSTTLFDNSWSSAGTSWSWLITGPDTFTSVLQNPAITPLTVPGWYNVQFVATNAAGSDTIYKPNYFLVSSGNAVFNEMYSEGFENPNYEYFGYVINNRANNGNIFHRTPGTSLTGSACLMLNNYGTTTKGDIDEFITPGYHLDYLTGIQLQFSYAHAAASNDSDDNTQALKIYTSIDCGQSWTLRWTRYGQALCNAGYQPGYFIPNGPADWQTVTVNLPVSCAQPNVRFKFEYQATEDDKGNNFYIDDINILGTNVGIAETQTDNLFSIYPNPGDGNSTIAYTLTEPAVVHTEIYDLSGRLVRSVYSGEQQAGAYMLPLGTDAEPLAEGTYIVRMLVGENVSSQKFVVTGR